MERYNLSLRHNLANQEHTSADKINNLLEENKIPLKAANLVLYQDFQN